jgi:hypothetical protein
MLSMSLSRIVSDRPDLAPAAVAISRWMDSNAHAELIDPVRVYRELLLSGESAKFTLVQFADVFRLMEVEGQVTGYFRLKNENETLLGGDFESPDEIPDVVEDIFGRRHNKDDCEIAVVYKVSA